MELILTIILGFCVAGIGFLIGTAAGNKLEKQHERKAESLQQSLDSAPMVIECQLDQPLTVDQMAMDVVGPNLIKIWRHFGKPLYNMLSSSKVAEEMLQWYNQESEYTKLVIVGWLRDGGVRIAWTWQQKDPKYIITKDAVKGLEKYYEDELGNPMVLVNQEV